jgi:hypothetical protein
MQGDGVNHVDIRFPAGDPNFPDGTILPLTRAIIDPLTGAGTLVPATAINNITGWLDASMIYGSTDAVANSLRSNDGRLLTLGRNNLPRDAAGLVMAGDIRAQENPALTALQTLFMREHNRQVDLLHAASPLLTAEELYQAARAKVIAEIEKITLYEFLPHLLGTATPGAYAGYDPTVDPRITEEFAGAAFRFGHSIVSNETGRIDNDGIPTGEEIPLKDAFFLPADEFTAEGGADGFLRHLGTESSQAMDGRIVDGLRNFLADPPASMDLAAINIQRGRELGLGTLNNARVAMGLAPYTDFSQITDDQATVQALAEAFGVVEAVDLWTGGLSEKNANGGMLGETFAAIVGDQFTRLRDGDRLWFENLGVNRADVLTLSQVIVANTDTSVMQADAFVTAVRHASNVASPDPDAPQLVIGQDGSPSLTGGSFDDTLAPAAGNQVMTGGAGGDDFVFSQLGTQATITDYNAAQDQIMLGGDPTITMLGSAALIRSGGDTIFLPPTFDFATGTFLPQTLAGIANSIVFQTTTM